MDHSHHLKCVVTTVTQCDGVGNCESLNQRVGSGRSCPGISCGGSGNGLRRKGSNHWLKNLERAAHVYRNITNTSMNARQLTNWLEAKYQHTNVIVFVL